MHERRDANFTDGLSGVAVVRGLPEKAADNPGIVLLGPEIARLPVNRQVSGIGQRNVDDPTLWRSNRGAVRMACTTEKTPAILVSKSCDTNAE